MNLISVRKILGYFVKLFDRTIKTFGFFFDSVRQNIIIPMVSNIACVPQNDFGTAYPPAH